MGLMEPACVSFLMGSGGGTLGAPCTAVGVGWGWGGGFRKDPHLLEAAFGHGEPRADGDDGVGVAHGQDLLPQRGDAFQLQLLALQRLQQLLTEGTEGGGGVGWGAVTPAAPRRAPRPHGLAVGSAVGRPCTVQPQGQEGDVLEVLGSTAELQLQLEMVLSCSCSWRWC